jgi:hydrogenase maturation protease
MTTGGSGRTLVAGVGNIFFGDDGFGVEVARRLAECELPAEVTVADYGISGMHLAYDLSNGYDRAILIDATPRGGTPGTVYVLEPDQPADADGALADTALADGALADGAPFDSALFDAHGMQPDVVLGMLGMLGGKTGRMLIVGCEPASAGPGIGLSAPVAAAVDDAVRTVLELI